MGDPSYNLDELLKAYARKRREEGGDPPPLHSAVRHQLQDEVRRTYATPARAGRPWFARFLLRPAVAGGLALAMVALGIFATLWPRAWPPVDGATLAESSPSVPPSAKQEARARTPAPKSDPTTSSEASPKSMATGGGRRAFTRGDRGRPPRPGPWVGTGG